jgi:hypothetical protein
VLISPVAIVIFSSSKGSSLLTLYDTTSFTIALERAQGIIRKGVELTTVPPPASQSTKHSLSCQRCSVLAQKYFYMCSYLQELSVSWPFCEPSRSINGSGFRLTYGHDALKFRKILFTDTCLAQGSEGGVSGPISPVLI